VELHDIKDPDPLMNCDLMDGRDAFLTLSRDKHYEFSSLRRAMYSSIGLLYELHTQARDSFIYNCNACKASVETRYHCPTCDVSLMAQFTSIMVIFTYWQSRARSSFMWEFFMISILVISLSNKYSSDKFIVLPRC